MLEIIQKALDDGQIACGIFIDLTKVFDAVSHDILLEKLDDYGIRGISNDWFRSCLSDRSQFVSINGFKSDYKTIKYSFPQGLVLGFLLFLIFINDLNTAIKNYEIFHFAADTYLLSIKDSVKKIKKVGKKDLKFLVQWLNINRISVNVAKTEVAIFRRNRKHLECDLNLKLCGKKLKSSNYVRYLVIYLDEYLNWSTDINHLSQKLVKANAMLCKLRYLVNVATTKSIFHSHQFFMLYFILICHMFVLHGSKSEL